MTDFKENIEQSLNLLYKLEKQPSKKKLLDKAKTIYLQIGLFKIPYVPSPIKKFLRLKYSMHGDEPEICLFVPNRKMNVGYKKTTDEFIDFCVDYYTELLEKHKVKGISTVMPLKQLRAEYGAYELRRKLVRRYDLFLCKNSLLYNPRFVSALGKIFKDASREPLGIPFPKEESDYDPDFQKNIDRAICTTTFVIKQGSDNYTIPFGSLSNTRSQLKENLEAVLEQLFSEKMIPGGLQNVRIMFLWPSQSKPIPLFINPELPPKDKNPRVKMARRKKKRPIGVEGELSTQPGKKVMVMPNGEVFVTSIRNEPQPEVDSESEDSFRDDSEDEEEEKKKKENSKMKNKKNEEESESEDDEEIEEKEERLLRGIKKAEEEEDDDGEESAGEDSDTGKRKKEVKGKKRKKVSKSNRKLLIKQKSKAKRKKV